tara:strand:+ start:3152 stop:4537 length:1386 start_codon:yes stop_codon:yes gene_type:complete
MQNNQVQNLTLNDIISETFQNYKTDDEYSKTLISVLKNYNLWPALQVKKFKGQKNLVLLHNTYLREDINEFKNLYEECRSVILDFEGNEKVVVSYANSIPVRMNINDYNNEVKDNDVYREAYDGTTITCYYYNNKWHFGTTSCPDVNSSWFSHPTKTHGVMLDEVLNKLFSKLDNNQVVNGRERLTEHLDKNNTYIFVLVHSENKHIIDYTGVLGENYGEIIHIDSKNIHTNEDVSIENKPLSHLNVIYPREFSNNQEAYNYVMNPENNSYGYIVKRYINNKYYLAKISSDVVSYREETDPCHPNPWYNILATYMKNKQDYHINNYINDYKPNIEKITDNNGKDIDPTYLIHTSICTIKDIIYKLYMATTTYNPKRNIFKMNKELDKQLAPILRFHLAKLRKRQITIYTSMITARDVYYYLCHCLRPNDIKQIIQLLTTSSGFEISERSMLCLVILNRLLN